MGLNKSKNNELFSEKIPYIQLNASIKDRASCVDRKLHKICVNRRRTEQVMYPV
jgi:hypothetical protein